MSKVWIEDRADHAEYQQAMEKWAEAKRAGSKRNPPGRWRVRWYGPDGKPKSLTVQKLPQAEAEKRSLEERFDKGTYRDPKHGKTQFRTIAEDWFGSLRKQSQRTKDDYREALDLHVLDRWGDHKLASIRWEDVDTWLTDLCAMPGKREGEKLSASRVRKIFLVFGMVMRFAAKTGKIASAVAVLDHELPALGEDDDHVYLSHVQVAALAAAAGKYRPLVLLLGYTGLRWGEATAVTVGRVQIDSRRIRITQAWSRPKGGPKLGPVKNHEKRSVPLSPFLVEELRPLIAERPDAALLFLGAGGERLPYTSFRQTVFDRAVVAAGLGGLGVTPHKLRHTAASLAIASGADPKVVQTMLGHKSAAMTLDIYGHLWPDRLDEVANAMDAARKSALAARSSEALSS
jgi:integrase